MWIVIPFLLQAVAIILDEGVFHVKRGLPKWERIGHPLDTLSMLLCMIFVLVMPFTLLNLKIYSGLAILSCVMVTKDEFVHKHFCPAAENWLHSLLFTLHPITLAAAGTIWALLQGAELPLWLNGVKSHPQQLQVFLFGQTTLTGLFMVYQIVFWGILWKNKPVIRH